MDCFQNKDGFISHSELRKVIETFTYHLTNDQFMEVLSRLDPINKGQLSFREFIAHFGNEEDPVCVGKSPCIHKDICFSDLVWPQMACLDSSIQ